MDDTKLVTKKDLKATEISLKKDFEALLETGLQSTKTDVSKLKTDVGTLKTDVGELKTDVQLLAKNINTMMIENHQKHKETKDQIRSLEESHEETRSYMTILFEDLEEKILGANRDQASLHSDKLKNHEQRIGRLENKSFCAA